MSHSKYQTDIHTNSSVTYLTYHPFHLFFSSRFFSGGVSLGEASLQLDELLRRPNEKCELRGQLTKSGQGPETGRGGSGPGAVRVFGGRFSVMASFVTATADSASVVDKEENNVGKACGRERDGICSFCRVKPYCTVVCMI